MPPEKSLTLRTSIFGSMSEPNCFWDLNGYRVVVKRVENGYKLCNDLAAMIQERSEVEKSYSQHLQKWVKKWENYIKNAVEYGSGSEVWMSICEEGSQMAEYHLAVQNSLIDKVESAVRVWNSSNYNKGMTGLKEAKFYEGEFAKAQKNWMKHYKTMEEARRDYLNSCRQLNSLQIQLSNTETNNADAEKKLSEKIKKLEVEVRKMKNSYEHSVEELGLQRESYVQAMTEVFGKCQQFERKRLELFHQTFLDMGRNLDKSDDDRLKGIAKTFNDNLTKHDIEKDLEEWSQKFGAESEATWPTFKEYDPEEDKKAMVMGEANRKQKSNHNLDACDDAECSLCRQASEESVSLDDAKAESHSEQ